MQWWAQTPSDCWPSSGGSSQGQDKICAPARPVTKPHGGEIVSRGGGVPIIEVSDCTTYGKNPVTRPYIAEIASRRGGVPIVQASDCTYGKYTVKLGSFHRVIIFNALISIHFHKYSYHSFTYLALKQSIFPSSCTSIQHFHHPSRPRSRRISPLLRLHSRRRSCHVTQAWL